MTAKIYFLVVILLVIMLLVGCSQGNDLQVNFSCDDFIREPHRSQEIHVKIGKSFSVALCSTDLVLSWNATMYASILEETQRSGMAGKGIQSWVFKALKEGTASILFEYNYGGAACYPYPPEPDEIGLRTLMLTVVVDE
jgi:hypothetical protein